LPVVCHASTTHVDACGRSVVFDEPGRTDVYALSLHDALPIWWEHDPWLTGKSRELVDENRRLRERLAAVEERLAETRPVEGHLVEDEPIERRATRRAERRRD